ncbi:hypothetical protein Tco_1001751 [Tanacetum coccineum]
MNSSCVGSGFGPARATRLTSGSGLSWSSSILSSSGGGRDSGVLPGSYPAWPSSISTVFSSRFTKLVTSSPCYSPICSIFVLPPLFVLSVSAPVLASAGKGDSRTIFADVANNDCATSSSVAIDFPLPSTAGSGRVASVTGSRIATPPTCA